MMGLDYGQLKEVVTREDIMDQEEYLESLLWTQRNFVARVRFQYQQESWISLELEALAEMMDQISERLSTLRDTNCFPPES
jgi:hypothetical protein